MTLKRVSLISFAPSVLSRELQDTLRHVNCDTALISGSAWLKEASTHRSDPALLLLDGTAYPYEQIAAVLKKQAHRPFAVVIPREHDRCDREILNCCAEYIAWPCPALELEFRLARLGMPQSGSHTESIDGTRLLEEFSALNLVGQSPVFLDILRLIKKTAHCEVAVLVEGETGTGKELAARAIHYLGARRDYPFIPMNCAAVPDNLFENELFGHERGAFTDAKAVQAGLVAHAQGGTLFLDEIDTLSPKGQAALLRFLEDQQYRPLGASRLHQANVRIIAASNRQLDTLVQCGDFRKDLYFRLNIIRIGLPPLRKRAGDKILLAQHFLQRFAAIYCRPPKRFSLAALSWLDRQPWPGNVRELENLVHREFLMSEGSEIFFHHAAVGASDPRNSSVERSPSSSDLRLNFNDSKAQVIADFERSYLTALLAETRGNVTRAAHKAVKERRALGKLLKKHGIDAARYRDP